MTESEKAAAFDLLAAALVHQWADGRWTWWASSPCGGTESRGTPAEAVADLLAWAERTAKRKRRLTVIQPTNEVPCD